MRFTFEPKPPIGTYLLGPLGCVPEDRVGNRATPPTACHPALYETDALAHDDSLPPRPASPPPFDPLEGAPCHWQSGLFRTVIASRPPKDIDRIMYLFKLVKQALDVLYEKAKSEYGSSATVNSAVCDHLVSFTSNYRQLTDAENDPIDYDHIAARIAYLFCYVAAHADHVRDALQSLRRERDSSVFDRSHLHISSIGSGPGTDILGVLKYLHQNPAEPVTAIHAQLFDREPAWKDARKALKRAYRTHAEVPDGDRLRITTKTTSLNVHNRRRWRAQGCPHLAELVTLSYFVSEAYSQNQESAARWLKKLFRRLQPDTYVLYVDNDSKPLTDYFDILSEEAALEPLYGYSGELRIADSEQRSELAPYDSSFADRSPKLRSHLCVRFLTKST